LLAEKGRVHRGGAKPIAQLRGGGGEHIGVVGLVRAGPRQHATPRHGRERHGDLQLGIIAPAGVFVGRCPGVIEHILAGAVELHVARRAGGNAALAVIDGDVLRDPTGMALPDAAGRLQRVEERMGYERIERRGIGIGARVPGFGVDIGDARHDAGDGPPLLTLFHLHRRTLALWLQHRATLV
jgi:hypothetical protein